MGGPGPPLFLDQAEARRAEKNLFLSPASPPYFRAWMTAPPYLKVWIRSDCNILVSANALYLGSLRG